MSEAITNPFAKRCYTMSDSHLSGYRLIVGFERLEDAQDAHTFVANVGRAALSKPAPLAGEVTREQMVAAVRPLCNTDAVAEKLVDVSMDEYRAILALHSPQAVPMTLEPTNDVGLVPVVIKPFTQAQRRRLWGNSPEIHEDAASIAGFERIVSLTERAHGITDHQPTKEAEKP